MIRIAIIPLLGMAETAHDSNFRVFEDVIKQFNKYGKPVHWYFFVPEKDGLPELPNTTYVESDVGPQGKNFFSEIARPPGNIYDKISWLLGDYVVDAILTSRTSAAAVMSAIVSDFRLLYSIPIHIFDPKNRLEQVKGREIRKAMVFGYSNAYTWFLNSYEKDIAAKRINGMLSPSLSKEFEEKSYVLGTPIETDEMEAERVKPKPSTFTIFWGARLSNEKNPVEMAKIMEKFNSSGRKVNFLLRTPQNALKPTIYQDVIKQGKGVIKEFDSGGGRRRFFDLVSQAHIFLCTSTEEGFPAGFIEQLYITDGVGIFPNEEWALSVLPENYPFIYRNLAEAHALLSMIYDDYEGCKKKVGWVKDWIRNNFNGEKISDYLYNVFLKSKQVKGERYYILGGRFGEIINNGIKELDNNFSFEDLAEYLNKNSTSWRRKKEKRIGVPCEYAVHRHILASGYEDDTSMEMPFYRKKR